MIEWRPCQTANFRLTYLAPTPISSLTLLPHGAGPFVGFMMMMAGLVVGGMMFSGSLLFALTFALPLLFGAGAVGMLSFWTFGLASVAFSLALPVLFAGVRLTAGICETALLPSIIPSIVHALEQQAHFGINADSGGGPRVVFVRP